MIRVLGFAVLVAIAIGCGSGSSATTVSPINSSDGSFLTCATEMRAMPPYQPGMHVASASGAFTVKLLESSPGPPVKGNNVWTLEVDEGAAGPALDGLDIVVVPYMPDHMHGTNPVGVTPAGAGTYTLAPVYLYMSGFWQVTVKLGGAAVAAGTDSAVIPICIP